MITGGPVIRAAIVAVMALMLTPLAFAQTDTTRVQETRKAWPRAYVQLGGFIMATESTFRLGERNIGLGLNLHVESFLDLDSKNTAFRIDGGFRSANRRHTVSLSWFRLNRSGTTTLTGDIQLPDSTVIGVGANVSSIFNFATIKLKYHFSFILDERLDANLGAGLYIMPLKYGTGEVGQERTEESITAPLPVISVGFNVALSTKWFFRQSVDLMYLEISGVTGSISDLNLSIERRIIEGLALGFGFESLNISMEQTPDATYPGKDFVGQYGFKYSGLQLYLRGSF